MIIKESIEGKEVPPICPKLVVLSESLKKMACYFEKVGMEISIGRTQDNNFCLNNPTISSHHCRASRTDRDTVMIEDLGSTNGTYINDCRLTPGEPCKITTGDILRLGSIEIFYDNVGTRSQHIHDNDHGLNNDFSQTTDLNTDKFGNMSPFKKVKHENKKLVIATYIVLAILAVASIAAVGIFLKELIP